MKSVLLSICVVTFISACSGTPTPQLPADADTLAFTHSGESFMRGLRVNGTVQRNSVIVATTYQLSCLSDGAQTRFRNAGAILDRTFKVAPIMYNNPRERRGWPADATKAVISTGCVVNNVDFDLKTADPVETLGWAFINGVPPV